jgi:hypothetical protein
VKPPDKKQVEKFNSMLYDYGCLRAAFQELQYARDAMVAAALDAEIAAIEKRILHFARYIWEPDPEERR